MYTTDAKPLPTPTRASARPATFASLFSTHLWPQRSRKNSATGNPSQPGRFGGFRICPPAKSSGPGQPMPMPSYSSPQPSIASASLLRFSRGPTLWSFEKDSLLRMWLFSSSAATRSCVPPMSIPTRTDMARSSRL